MSKKKEIIALLIVDTAMIVLASLLMVVFTYVVRYRLTLWDFAASQLITQLALTAFWLLTFLFAGLYRSWYRTSRLDEIVLIFKSVCLGGVFLLLALSIENIRTNPIAPTKLIVLFYGLVLMACVVTGRAGVRTFQKQLLQNGIGRRLTAIIGWNERAHELCQLIRRSPHYGYDVLGFVRVDSEEREEKWPEREPNPTLDDDDYHFGTGVRTYERLQAELKTLAKSGLSSEFSEEKDVLGTMEELPALLENHRLSEILIALDPKDHDVLLRIITICDAHREKHQRSLNVKIIPDLYTIISGQARTTQIEGIPLIELEPEIMPFWEQVSKRVFDVMLSLAILVGLLPLWVVVTILVKVSSRGPVFYKQERIGRHGKPYMMFKFRSMTEDAEAVSGPALAKKDDPRTTAIGRWLRKSRLDEFPQFYNVLKGDMSVVGPRPERAFFIEQIVKKAPHFIHLHRVRPGITGLGQVRYGYADNIDAMAEKSKYDILYIENMSLRLDFKIILHTIYVMLTGRGQ